MNAGKWVLAAITILMLGRVSLAADDYPYSEEQKKRLKEFEKTLAAPPLNPNAQVKYTQTFQDTFSKLLSTSTAPSKQTTDALANRLVRGLYDGQISPQQSVELSKVMMKVLDLKEITYPAVNQLVKSIDPLVQQTGLGANEKVQLYADVLRVIKTAPTYAPPP